MMNSFEITRGTYMVITTLHWVIFFAFVTIALAADLLMAKASKNKGIQARSALKQSIFWVGLGIVFGLGVTYFMGADLGQAWFTGFVLEKALSVDNLFVFIRVFNYFKVPVPHQQRVLLWGIIGAVILRGIFIAGGVVLIEQFHWVLYLMGAFLLYSGVKLGLINEDDEPADLNDSKLIQFLQKHLPFTAEYNEDRFTTKSNEGKTLFTPLFLVLLVIEFSDVVFAVDSVPAIFGVTLNPFIIYTSNIFAILGLRALFFLLSDALERIHFLNYALAFVLSFIGVKLLLGMVDMHISTGISLGIVFGALGSATLCSFVKNKRDAKVGNSIDVP